MSTTSLTVTDSFENIQEQFSIESNNLQTNNPIKFYRNRQYAFEEDDTQATVFTVEPRDHLESEFLTSGAFPRGNGTIIQCPPRTMLVLFNDYTPFIHNENFTLVTDWTRPNMKMDGIGSCKNGDDQLCLRHNLRYGMVDLEQLANDEDSTFNHLTLRNRLSRMNVWHPRWNLFKIIEYMRRAFGSFGSNVPCQRQNGQKSRYNFKPEYLPAAWSACDTLKFMIKRYIFFSVDFIYKEVTAGRGDTARDYLSPYISNREFDMMNTFWGIPGAHSGNNQWKSRIDKTSCVNLLKDWNSDLTYQWTTWKSTGVRQGTVSFETKDMDFFDCYIKGNECTKVDRIGYSGNTLTAPGDFCWNCSGCGKNLFGYDGDYDDTRYENYSVRCDNNDWVRAGSIPQGMSVTDGTKTCPFDPYGLTMPDGVNDKNDLCWKHSYLTSQNGKTKCADTPFLKNFCKGAPVDDLKIHVPDEDFPNAKWLSDATCKSMLTKDDLKELCQWAADNNHTDAISGIPVHEYCGCSAIDLKGNDVRAAYFWNMGPNKEHSDILLRMARTTGVAGNAYLGLFHTPAIQQTIASESDERARISLVNHIPGACWSSCSQFKHAKGEYDYAHLIHEQSRGYCMTTGCQNNIDIGSINSGTVNLEDVSIGCNYVTQYSNENPDLTVNNPNNPNNPNNDNNDNVSKKEFYIMFGFFFVILLLMMIIVV